MEKKKRLKNQLQSFPEVYQSIKHFHKNNKLIESFHQFLFDKKEANISKSKSNILKFSGFGKDPKIISSFQSKLNNWKIIDLRNLSQLIQLKKIGSKKDIISRIIQFLSNPQEKYLKSKSRKSIQQFWNKNENKENESTNHKKRKSKSINHNSRTKTIFNMISSCDLDKLTVRDILNRLSIEFPNISEKRGYVDQLIIKALKVIAQK
ncbi:protein dek [Anaeramoeba ignava]|uniref:Protein dek n=1 Tax=Anaeramoeba ignava TaxID=1746090 RepID=A0A9Q0REW1_ANAIG|nr:protein dek [Anaeramoeba ignava]